LESGNFDARLISSEDGDLTYRMAKKGHSFLFVPSARCYHDIELSPKSVLKNDIWLMKGFLTCTYKHGVKTFFFKEILAALFSLLGILVLIVLFMMNIWFFTLVISISFFLLLLYSCFRYRNNFSVYIFGFVFKRLTTAIALIDALPHLIRFAYFTE
jgi:GT2 family glycosyltransferase